MGPGHKSLKSFVSFCPKLFLVPFFLFFLEISANLWEPQISKNASFELKTKSIVKFLYFSSFGPFSGKVCFLKFQWSRKEPPGSSQETPKQQYIYEDFEKFSLSSFFHVQVSDEKR